jgi:hypothetical protein
LETEKHWTQKYFRFAMLFFPKSLIDWNVHQEHSTNNALNA